MFLSGVRIPAENVIGEVNGGWAVTHTTLGNERAVIGVGGGGRNADDVIALARSCGVTGDPGVRQEIMQAYIRTATLRYMGLRLRTAMSQGANRARKRRCSSSRSRSTRRVPATS